ncbi:MAG: hypothetical protein J0M07_02490 [Anaerolineae bacterium]|uniref:hypothetical protein n=1 Tax=Candidatus Flexifilum breve TaxID=3140694 RepID=UPI001AC69DC3|nr:hypothetical protein [Chloroflexota bacterium]MBK9749984.1 hypothetical protein [Chloroflexota bacterium]MBN8634165.1 hypothetical protein [Anaerolineae bacterium]
MTIIEVQSRPSGLTARQRWSHYFVLIYGVFAVIIGFNLRSATLTATIPYANSAAGIRAYYPQNWLLDTSGDYVFRVRDMAQTGFKTTIQVAVQPVTINTTARNLLDTLTLNRAPALSAYDVLSTNPYILPNERQATAMTYVFVASEANPFLESLPQVVEGLDVITIQSGQAIIVTFLSSVETYEDNLPIFERFLNDLEF